MGTIQPSATPILQTSHSNNFITQEGEAIKLLNQIKNLISQMESYLKDGSEPNIQAVQKEIRKDMNELLNDKDVLNPELKKAIDQVSEYYNSVIVPYTDNYERHPDPIDLPILIAEYQDFSGIAEKSIEEIKNSQP